MLRRSFLWDDTKERAPVHQDVLLLLENYAQEMNSCNLCHKGIYPLILTILHLGNNGIFAPLILHSVPSFVILFP